MWVLQYFYRSSAVGQCHDAVGGTLQSMDREHQHVPSLCHVHRAAGPHRLQAGAQTSAGCAAVPGAVPGTAEGTAQAPPANPPAHSGCGTKWRAPAAPRGPPPPTDPSLPRAPERGFRQGAPPRGLLGYVVRPSVPSHRRARQQSSVHGRLRPHRCIMAALRLPLRAAPRLGTSTASSSLKRYASGATDDLPARPSTRSRGPPAPPASLGQRHTPHPAPPYQEPPWRALRRERERAGALASFISALRGGNEAGHAPCAWAEGRRRRAELARERALVAGARGGAGPALPGRAPLSARAGR